MLHPFRETFLSIHHLKAKARGGTRKPNNCLKLWRDNHSFWHILFNNSTLDEIISKLSQHKCKFIEDVFMEPRKYYAYQFLFKDKSIENVLKLLKRIRRMKKSLGVRMTKR